MAAFDPNTPHNDLVALSSDLPIEVPNLMGALIEARVQLARLDELASTLSNPMVLVNAIAVVEAQASSAIENIVTTNDTLFQNDAVQEARGDTETLLVLRNRAALFSAYRFVERSPISANLAKDICSEILGYEVSIRPQPGTYIGSPQQRVYTPPSGKDIIESHLHAWQKFINTNHDLDPLIIMALSHYQFEAIHPFADGNGRTGRIINVAYLVASGLLKHPVLHLSRAINARRDEYYERLLAVTTANKWHEWVRFMLEIVASSAIRANRQIASINALQRNLIGAYQGLTFKQGVRHDLAALLFARPYARIGHVADECGVSRPTAAKWLEELEAVGFLKSVRVGREKYFVNWQMLEVLV